MIIGIAGNKQAGKDTICKIIQGIEIYDRIGPKKEPSEEPNTDKVEFVLEYLNNPNGLQSFWQRKQYAGKLKECAAIILGCNVEDFEHEFFKQGIIPWIQKEIAQYPEGVRGAVSGFVNFVKQPITVRELLQKLGTEVGRNIDTDIWVNALMNEYDTPINYTEPYWIISDVRFPNEKKAIEDRGGVVIKVVRGTESKDTHASEIALNSTHFDIIIYNQGSLADLVLNVMDFYEGFNS